MDRDKMRETLRKIIESAAFQTVVLIAIIVNAIILGAETVPDIRTAMGASLMTIDRIIIYAFTVEILLRIYAYRLDYFKNGWNIFDFIIVVVSLVAATSGLAAIRAFRVLRVLRLVTAVPRMRVVVSALLDAIPGIASVGLIVLLIVYVFAVIAASLYGPEHEKLFGDVFAAMYTLFQVMTLEGWPDIAAEVSQTHPNSWVFFLTFVMIATFTMLNLFVAIVVRVVEEDADTWVHDMIEQNNQISADVAEIKAALEELQKRG